MFAIFFHESMNQFHEIVTSFPTVFFSLLLIICMLYWVVAVLGLVDLNFMDVDYDGDIDATDSLEAQNGIAGVLMKFHLTGVPLTITLTLIAIFGWFICYYATYFLAPLIPGSSLQFIANIVIFIVATYLAILLTAQAIKPIRALFNRLNIDETKHIIGQTAVVRSAVVTSERGEAFLNDGAAGILLNVRASGDDEFKKGDEVAIIEKLNDNNLYRVISKSEFSGE